MLKLTRHTQIRQLVNTNGHVTVQQLNQLLRVSEATIRRDLDELSQGGLIHRTHGGAVKVAQAGREPPILLRQSEYKAEKLRIGRLAAAMVEERQTVFLGSGTTVHEIARNLRCLSNLTVITNAINVVNELVDCAGIELVVIGGMLRQSELSMVGHIAEAAIKELRADKVFMGMRGVHPQHGFTGDFLPEATTDRTILGIAPCNIIVADHSKLGQVSTVFLAPITAAHVLVTDKDAPPEFVDTLEGKGLKVHLA
ncbi:MAG: DeoR/GlpR family DNA-binding transcription regulator [Chloroflexi bacterium]|nr:DeoR/GlpR family DNA-binding transcription regulator [Chloroflexota bacterium]MCI0578073.1 DeoR/GlpR family DNA-binding transcription regulator [Chloroflexota bacterium]MCI0646061.1 DeoR/GlpR family DNA-binding transcription regulator [Chloroflexota bacterium]MCI0731001.1 DeoR/GlpR family DNA-binding transcription regulator [Chloroflexota bacterium]